MNEYALPNNNPNFYLFLDLLNMRPPHSTSVEHAERLKNQSPSSTNSKKTKQSNACQSIHIQTNNLHVRLECHNQKQKMGVECCFCFWDGMESQALWFSGWHHADSIRADPSHTNHNRFPPIACGRC
jgi:hypothetical protein